MFVTGNPYTESLPAFYNVTVKIALNVTFGKHIVLGISGSASGERRHYH